MPSHSILYLLLYKMTFQFFNELFGSLFSSWKYLVLHDVDGVHLKQKMTSWKGTYWATGSHFYLLKPLANEAMCSYLSAGSCEEILWWSCNRHYIKSFSPKMCLEAVVSHRVPSYSRILSVYPAQATGKGVAWDYITLQLLYRGSY